MIQLGKWQTQVAQSKGASNYAWLYSNLTDCESRGCSQNTSTTNAYGYWTSTARDGGSVGAWRVNRNGDMNTIYVNDPSRGVRPVITVSKSQIIP